MSIETVTAFFMWCTIINVALLALSFVMLVLARDWVYAIHSKWFPMPKDSFNVVLYSFLGLYKILFFVFNVVPYIALLIVS